MKAFCVCVASFGLISLAGIVSGCRHIEPSPIVSAFHDAGGGDIDNATPASIAAFLAKHEDLRKQLTPLCNQKKAAASASWATTDEGKVCAGNASANFFGKPTLKSDGVAF
jgi:hypothetical protein